MSGGIHSLLSAPDNNNMSRDTHSVAQVKADRVGIKALASLRRGLPAIRLPGYAAV